MCEKSTEGNCKAGSLYKKHVETVKRASYRNREVFLESSLYIYWFQENPPSGPFSDRPHVLIYFIYWVERTLKGVTNSPAVFHKSWMIRCSPRAPGF